MDVAAKIRWTEDAMVGINFRQNTGLEFLGIVDTCNPDG